MRRFGPFLLLALLAVLTALFIFALLPRWSDDGDAATSDRQPGARTEWSVRAPGRAPG